MPDLSLPIASFAAVANGLILLALTCRVIHLRRRDKIVLGDNNDRIMTKVIRGQANAAEQIPMAIVLLALCEIQGAHFGLLVLLAHILTVGRLAHGVYFARHGTPWQFRLYGMFLTLVAQVSLLLVLLFTTLIS